MEFSDVLFLSHDIQTTNGIVLGLIQLLDEIHCKFYIHGNIKPYNIIIASNDNNKWIFKMKDDYDEKIMGYDAPEVLLRKKDITPKIDIFSMGVIIFNLITNKVLFKSNNYAHLKQDKYKQKICDKLVSTKYPGYIELILKMLEFKPCLRYNIDDVKIYVKKIIQ